MSFLNLALLGGVAAIALPIALHLIMRRQPQRMEFPALRFVRQRSQTNQHRLRLRHLLLLLLRCAVLGCLALALARPVIFGSGLRSAPTASAIVGLVVDNSLAMTYQQGEQTRLDAARELATWFVEQLPATAQATVVDRSTQRSAKLADRDAALLRLERLVAAPARRTLAEAAVEAIDALATSGTARQSVYIFTDQAASSFDEAALDTLADALARVPTARLHLVDLGSDRNINAGLEPLELSTSRPSAREPLTVRTRVYGNVPPNSVVELWLGASNAPPTKRGEQPANADASIEFTLAGFEAGVEQGYVRLVATDPLPIDNTRYFTLEIVESPPVLLVEAEAGDAVYVREAIAPSALGGAVAARFECDTTAVDQLTSETLTGHDAVMLFDPPPLAATAWRALSDFAQSGGGVGVFLGRRSVGHLAELNGDAAQLVLPGRLKWTSRTPRYLQPRSYDHPTLRELKDIGTETPWPAFPVFTAWQFESLDATASVVAHFADGAPALVDQPLGAGRVVVLATPLSDRATSDAWNLLATNPEPWPFLALASGMADYLAGVATEPLDYTAGASVVIPIPRRVELTSFVLAPPEGEGLSQTLDPAARDIVVSATAAVGNWRIESGGTERRFARGFSTNTDATVGQTDRASFDDIASRLGSDRITRARTHADLSKSIDLGSSGSELFPWLITAVAMFLASEHWLANRFYQSRE